MNKSYKKSSKILLLLSTTTILSALINAPIIGLANSNNVDVVTEEMEETDHLHISTGIFERRDGNAIIRYDK